MSGGVTPRFTEDDRNNSGKAEDIESWGGGGADKGGRGVKPGKKLKLGYMSDQTAIILSSCD